MDLITKSSTLRSLVREASRPDLDIRPALSIQGWMAPIELRWLAKQAAQSSKIIELGAWKGRSTWVLARHVLGQVYTVDHFKGDTGTGAQDTYAEFVRNLQGLEHKYTALRMSASEALVPLSLRLPLGADFIFIDDDHAYENVHNNIARYSALIRRGGVIAGHDFGVWPGVDRAVKELIRKFNVVGSIWWRQIV